MPPTPLTDSADVLALQQAGAQVVEVLPADDYDSLHIAGAINIPLREIDERARAELDPSRPIVVYCNDAL